MKDRKLIKRLVNYNLKFFKNKLNFIMVMFIVINIINLLVNNSIKLTGLDYIVLSLGGYDINNIDFMTVIIALYPYILIAMFIERYISDFIEKKRC